MGTAALAAFASIAWVVNYFRGKRPIGAEQVDYFAGGVKGAAEYMGDKLYHATDYAKSVTGAGVEQGRQMVGQTYEQGKQTGQQVRERASEGVQARGA